MTAFISPATAGMPFPSVDSAPAASVEVVPARVLELSWVEER
jgi:hypothetical protein